MTDTSSRSITPVAGADDIAIANLDVENPYSMYGVRVLAGQLANAFAGDYAGNTDSLKEDLVRMITENDQKAVFVVISDTGSRVITDSIGKADFAGYENAEAAESGDEILSVELVVIVNQSHEAVTEYSDGTHFYNTVSRVTVVDAAQNKVLWMQTFDDGQKGDYIKTYVGSSADTYGYDPFLQQIRDLLADGNTTLDHVGKLYQKFVK